jgi:diketogulonate reductase-like aldo/keto reductase
MTKNYVDINIKSLNSEIKFLKRQNTELKESNLNRVTLYLIHWSLDTTKYVPQRFNGIITKICMFC